MLTTDLNLDNNKNLYSPIDETKIFKKTKVSSFAEIWECEATGAKSLHATLEFLPGDIIRKIEITDYVDKPHYLSVQIEDNKHIMLKPEFLQYINHSCEPNVFFDTTNMDVVCLKKIKIGEAMTFFYPSTEWSMTQSFDCMCNTDKCIGKIEGAAYLSTDIITKYQFNEHIKLKLQNK